MDIYTIIGHTVEHPTWGNGIINNVDDRYVWVGFNDAGVKKYQFPQAFTKFLTIDSEKLQKEILMEEKKRIEKEQLARQVKTVQPIHSLSSSKERQRPAAVSKYARTIQNTFFTDKKYNDHILEIGNSFSTHAEALNNCFGFDYKQYLQAYKYVRKGFAVWFPSIAIKAMGEYVSTDSFSGWVNILSDDQKKLIQIDNPTYPNPQNKEPDLNKRIIFAKFENDNRYRFIGIYADEKRVGNGFEYTRIGTKIDTTTMQIIEE